jgi:hypothetical protein
VSPFRHLKRAIKPLFAARIGTPFSLGLRGNLLAVGDGSVQLEVDRVRHYPGGRWLDVDPRIVELAVPEGAELEGFGDVTAARRVFATPVPVTAYTRKAKTTADAIVGVAGSLKASRVERLSG